MDIESIGGGVGAGLIGAILGVFGINRRVSKIEEQKQDKSACIPIHKGIDEKFLIMVDIQREIKEDQRTIRERIDSINDHLRNGKR